MGAGTGCIIGGIILAVIGLGVILIGIVAPLELPQQKEHFLVVDSKNSKQYSDWAGGYDKKNNYQMVFTFFNLSNPDEVRSKAAVPIYTTVGPYIYRRYRQAQDVTFLDDGNQVQFIDFRDYQFDQAASNGLSDLDHIVNVNPVYVSALAQAGGEQNMLVAAGGGYLTNFTAYLTGDFISAYTSFTIPTYLPAAVNKLIAAINATVENTDIATDLFLETWCNSTAMNATWEGMMISSFYNVPSGISKASAQALLNASQSLSLYDTDPMSAWTWDRAINSTYYASLLITQLGLTQEQINAIWHWRLTAFGPAFIYPSAIEKYDLDEINDIGYVQWTSGDGVLGGSADNPVSIGDVFPISEIGYAIPIELWEAPVEASFPDWRFSKQILNPNVGLGNITIFQTFVMAISMNLTQDYSPWGFNAEQAGLFFGYSLQIGEGIVPTALMQLFGPSGGLILDQSVAEWTFNCNPFLSNLLLPDPPYCSLLLNHSVFSNVTIYTGKRNISQINQYIDWQGSDVVSGIWQGPLPVSGCTELGQFVPDLTTGGNPGLTTFNDEFFRTMYLNYTGKSSVRDIDTYQYVLDYEKIFSPNDFYFQTVPGFANITTIKQAPIFYSLWDMLYVNESLKSMVKVLNASATSELTASTVIDVEPITGNTLRARKRLQANVQTPFNCPWCDMGTTYSPFGNTNFPPGTFFPLVQAGEYVEISSELAHQVWLQVNALKYLPNTAGIVACILIGSAVLCVGVVLNVIGCRRRKNSGGYDEIN